MKNVVKTIIGSLTVCLLLLAPGVATAAHAELSDNAAIFQGRKPPERPIERDKPKDDKRGEEKKDDKKKKPDFF